MNDLWYRGLRVVINHHPRQKWEQHSRSPGRSKRRAAMGHRQHHRAIPDPDAYILGGHTLIVTPAQLAVLRAATG